METLIGSLKHHLGVQSRSGFTSSILIAPALAGKVDEEVVLEAMISTRERHVMDWARRYIGRTVQSKRRQFYGLTTVANGSEATSISGTENRNIISVEIDLKTG